MQTCRCEQCGQVLAVFATIAPGLALPASTGPVMAQVEARAREHERACGRSRSAGRVFRAVRGPGYAGVGSSGAGSSGGSRGLELVEFDLASAPAVSSWARTAQEVQAWCSQSEAPVPPDVVAGWSQAPDVLAYLLVDGAEPIGYGELWVDDEEAEVELARLIVEPAHRGRGVGRDMVARLVQKAMHHHSSVLMRVHPDNLAARRCYAAAGFTRVPAEDEVAWNQGQPVQYVWMALSDR
jgi:ribosomal protein S18 acetylase RimI-like enzyme